MRQAVFRGDSTTSRLPVDTSGFSGRNVGEAGRARKPSLVTNSAFFCVRLGTWEVLISVFQQTTERLAPVYRKGMSRKPDLQFNHR